MKRAIALLSALVMLSALCACGNFKASSAQHKASPKASAEAASGQIMNIAFSFAQASLDPHKDYHGWYTSSFGMSETLFKLDETSTAQPLLAQSTENDGKTWTVILRDGVTFSNGDVLTADMAVRNIQRVGEVNERFAYLSDFAYAVVDDKTFTITTPEVYPTMKSDLAAPELAMMNLDAATAFDTAPVLTGPFVISEFTPNGDVAVSRNESYWNGDVKLAGANFYYMQEDDPKQMAMENGEIDCYTSVTAAALEIYEADPETYTVTVVPATRLQFYVLNKNTLDAAVREAINLTIDKEAIAEYLSGTVSPAVGPFGAATPYGKVTVPAVNTEKAESLLEADGYTMGANGIYEKNGTPLSVNICYYAARSLDSLSILIQEQLKAVGIDSVLTAEEDPDATYIATGNYDMALYCMIADKSGDPYYCCDALFRADGRWSLAGFRSDACEALLNQLQYETDTARRAELANQIVQLAIDDHAFGFVGLFNKTTVMHTGCSGYSEGIPFDFYGIDANTSKEA